MFEGKGLLDSFGKVMGEFLLNNDVALLAKFPAGSLDPEIKDNIELGPAIDLYLLFKALKKVLVELEDEIMALGGELDSESLIDDMLILLKQEILSGRGRRRKPDA